MCDFCNLYATGGAQCNRMIICEGTNVPKMLFLPENLIIGRYMKTYDVSHEDILYMSYGFYRSKILEHEAKDENYHTMHRFADDLELYLDSVFTQKESTNIFKQIYHNIINPKS